MKRYLHKSNTYYIAYDDEHSCEVITQCAPKYLETVLDMGFSPVDPETFEPVSGIAPLHELYNKFICGEIALAR